MTDMFYVVVAEPVLIFFSCCFLGLPVVDLHLNVYISS